MNARDEWLAARKLGIGGSDIAAVLGISKFKTPFALWMEKTGRADQQHDAAAEERMYWGNALEDAVARRYAELHDVKIQKINTILRHPTVPIAQASIDRAVVVPGSRARWDEKAGRLLGASRILEVKTANAFAASNADEWGEAGSDMVPAAYWVQVQWYLGITGLPFADLAVLFGGQKYREYIIHSDAGLFADMLDEANGWWQRHIIEDIPPEPQSEAEARQRWGHHNPGKTIGLPADLADQVRQYERIKADIKALEDQAQRLRDAFVPALADADTIYGPDGQVLATYRANKPSQKTNWKAAADEIKGWVIGQQIDGGVDAVRDIIDRNTTETPGARVLRIASNNKE